MNADVAALIIDSKSTQLTEPALDSDTLGIDLIRNQDKLNSTLHWSHNVLCIQNQILQKLRDNSCISKVLGL